MTLTRTTPLKRGAGLERSTGLRVKPATGRLAGRKRRPELDVPQVTRDAVRHRSAGRCEAQLPDVCAGPASDVHHRKRRREGGHAISNLLDLCRACHRHVTEHPAEARELGLIVSVYEDPATVPVLVYSHLLAHRARVLLTDDGRYNIVALA